VDQTFCESRHLRPWRCPLHVLMSSLSVPVDQWRHRSYATPGIYCHHAFAFLACSLPNYARKNPTWRSNVTIAWSAEVKYDKDFVYFSNVTASRYWNQTRNRDRTLTVTRPDLISWPGDSWQGFQFQLGLNRRQSQGWGFCLRFLYVCPFFPTIFQKTDAARIALNLTQKCSTVSPGNPFIWRSKGKRS